MPNLIEDYAYKPDSHTAQPREVLQISDGDTPVIQQPIRMVSCDTPEKAGYAGKPETSQPKLDLCRSRLESGFYPEIPEPLCSYLLAKLTPDAAKDHINAGNRATEVFNATLEERLTRPDGKKRKAGIIPSGEIIDRYGRLLAYLTPWYSNTESDPLPPVGAPERHTFNLNMIDDGWAAFFPIYPSLPRRKDDWLLTVNAAESAWINKKGAWVEFGDQVLLGYEYRLCIKLGTEDTATKGMEKAFQRHCVDIRTSQLKGLFGFWEVPPCYRLWIWGDDLEKAIIDLDLVV
jgi:endonuclease YncB( thermonuclease family)